MNEENSVTVHHVDVFPWNENFDTHIPIIDEQHKKLLALINLLANHFVSQSGTLTINAIFNELTAYAVYHFHTEETIWHEHFLGDELEIEHSVTHNKFIQEVERLKNKEDSHYTEQIIEEILSFLTQWLPFHILVNDKRMAQVIVLMQTEGISLQDASYPSGNELTSAMKFLISTVLSMYENICSRTVQLIKEIVERQKIEAKQRLSSHVFEHTLDAICITDHNLNVIEINPSFWRGVQFHLHDLIGQLSPHDLIGLHLPELKPALKSEHFFETISQQVAQQGFWSGEIYNPTDADKWTEEWLTLSSVKNGLGIITNYVAVFSNVAHLLEIKHELEHHAYYDVLTTLPNRILLGDRLKLALAHADRNANTLAVCYLDLDGFKAVNDTLGHAAGDELLKEIARRFSKLIRANDTVARLGGDEFILLLSDLNQPADYEVLLHRLLNDIQQTVQIGNDEAHVSASIGVTLYPLDKSSPEELLKHADLAMYEAKESGKSKYILYDLH